MCTRICPVDIKVHNHLTVVSEKYHACLKCRRSARKKHPLYLSCRTHSGFKAAGICGGNLPVIYRGFSGGKIDRLLAERHLQQRISIPRSKPRLAVLQSQLRRGPGLQQRGLAAHVEKDQGVSKGHGKDLRNCEIIE